MAEILPPLDLLSTSQTSWHTCPYGAPLAAVVVKGKGMIIQSCCNHWDCPCCGQRRAAREYRRIVNGCEIIAKNHKLYFWTLTCRGRELSLEDAEANYLAWTNRLLTNARTKASRAGRFWVYVQVTERQKKTRLHPHSHIITTFLPDDAVGTSDAKGRRAYVSLWFQRANESAGLGSQCRISEVANAAAVSRYVAKYLFKDTMRDVFPPKWKRIRYSQNFPPFEHEAADLAIVLLTPTDWRAADHETVDWVADNSTLWQMAQKRLGRLSLRSDAT